MSVELSILFAFGAMLCWGFGDFFIQKTVRKIGDIESLALIGIAGTIFLLPLIFNDLFSLSFSDYYFLAGVGILSFIVSIIALESLARGKLSAMDSLFEFELPLTVLIGVFLLGEILFLHHLVLIFLILAGILMISVSSLSFSSIPIFEKGAWFAILGAFGFAVTNFLVTIGSRSISPFMVIWISWLFFAIGCLIIIWKRKKLRSFVFDSIKFKSIAVPMAVLDTAAWIFFALAVTYGALSITVAITESYIVITLFLGLFVNKEKLAFHQLLGAILVTVSCVALGILA